MLNELRAKGNFNMLQFTHQPEYDIQKTKSVDSKKVHNSTTTATGKTFHLSMQGKYFRIILVHLT